MANSHNFDVVTGAFGYTGKYITWRLLAAGRGVRTLTGHPHRPDPFGGRVQVAALDFRDPAGLVESLRGASVLYNSYWVRFSHGRVTFDGAVENSKILIQAAKDARVRKIVHISIANPSIDSHLPYYAGKAHVEQAIVDSGLPYSILRPIVIFGREDILINNIAWFVRHFPVFAIPGSGEYGIQPVFVEDVADLAVNAGRADGNLVLDAAGPEIFSFNELVRRIASSVGSKTKIVHIPPSFVRPMLRLLEPFIGDVILTREEIDGLLENLLVSRQTPTGTTRLSDWLLRNASTVGEAYASELKRHYG